MLKQEFKTYNKVYRIQFSKELITFSLKAGLLFVFVFFIWSPVLANVKETTIGKTYHIEEPDIYEELMSKVRSIDWNKIINSEKILEKVKKWNPGATKLPRAEKQRVFQVDLTWTLPYDIKDINGKIIYPKGYTFNPLDYVNLYTTLVIIDGTDIEQVEWFESSIYHESQMVMLLITDGSWYNLSRRLKRAVYWALPQIIETFKLTRVPSVVYQKGNMLEVMEVKIEKK